MKTSEFTDFEEALLQGKEQRNWLFVGLLVSLALHGALCGYFYRTRILSTDAIMENRVQVPTFKVKNVEMQPLEKPAVDQTNPAAKPALNLARAVVDQSAPCSSLLRLSLPLPFALPPLQSA